jgi:small subunit ribosomal protein S16
LGYFNPIAAGKEIGLHISRERVAHWVAQGAQPSQRVAVLLQQWDKQGQPPLQTAA